MAWLKMPFEPKKGVFIVYLSASLPALVSENKVKHEALSNEGQINTIAPSYE